jgi:acyl-CoA synthetase (AMP-forming)/AMP-acid ligase II
LNVAADLLSAGEPDAPALVAGGTVTTYRELRERIDDLAHKLIAAGYEKQSRVAICSENGVFFVVSYFATIRAGLVAVPLQPDSPRQRVLDILDSCRPAALLVSKKQQPMVRSWTIGPQVKVTAEDDLCDGDVCTDGTFPRVDPSVDLAALMFTSGSTGQPKGVMVTHRNIASNTRDIIAYMGLQPDDRVMTVLPFYYCFGLSLLHSHLAAGAAVVINNQFLYPERVLEEMEARGCTGFAGVPSTYQILLRKSRFKQARLSSLRWLQQAGGHLPPSSIREILDAHPAVRFYTMYGQTEATARLSYLPPESLPAKIGSVGRGLPSSLLEVVRSDGTPVTPGSGEIGEIVASGDHVTLGYWNDPAETARYFRNGTLHTGDLARVDADGYIYIVERARDLIKSGGNRIAAREVEDVIATLAGVSEVAVVGTPHDVLGEAVVAFITAADDPAVDTAAVLGHCRRQLPVFKVPEMVVRIERMPHGGSGKIAKAALRQLAAAVAEARGSSSERLHINGIVDVQLKSGTAARHALHQ